jgi:hypothetical protein
MNRHAEKVLPPLTAEEAARADRTLGGLVEEMHECPRCGRSAARPAR